MHRMAAGAEPDEQLMARFAAGDALAFETLYRRHELKIWRYLQRSVRNQATADELMQDVWFAVVREAGRYQPTARFTTWLFTLAHHRLIDNYRARKHPLAAAVAVGGAEISIEQLAAADHHEPAHQLQSARQAQALLTAVEQLPAEQREAFLLRAEGEQTVEEVAAATGVSFETAKSRLRYARAKLREWLREYA